MELTFSRFAITFLYSASNCLALSARFLLTASLWRFLWRVSGVTKRCIFGAFVLGGLP